MSRTVFVSFSSGILAILAALVAVALLNLPRTAGAAVAGTEACPLAEVSLDQGYGLSRTGFQPVCPDAEVPPTSGRTAAR